MSTIAKEIMKAAKDVAITTATSVANSVAKKVGVRRRKRNRKRPIQGPVTSSGEAPVALSNRISSGRMKITKNKDGSTTIDHHELIGTIVGNNSSAYFNPGYYALNPGLTATFPLLSVEATNYQEYKFNRLEFMYIPSVGSNQAGDLILSPNYNASQPAPSSEAAAINMKDASEDVVWRGNAIKLNPSDMCANSRNNGRKYVRTYSQAGDIKTFDSGSLSVGLAGYASNAVAGRLLVSYTVTLFGFTDNNALTAITPSQTFLCGNSLGSVQTNFPLNGSYTAVSFINTNIVDGLHLTNVPGNGQFSGANFAIVYLNPGSYRVRGVVNVIVTWTTSTAFNAYDVFLRLFKSGSSNISTSMVTVYNSIAAPKAQLIIDDIVTINQSDVPSGFNYVSIGCAIVSNQTGVAPNSFTTVGGCDSNLVITLA